MKPVWTRAAIRDLTHIREYIAREKSDAAREVALKIIDATDRIIQFPETGRIGRIKGTRESVVSGTNYLIVYRIKRTAIHFVRILHGRQNWPK
jgi:addiction module RelE/StbE family toxin